MAAKALTYEELMAYAMEHYDKGGDGVYECWDRSPSRIRRSPRGPITKRDALAMFKVYREVALDVMGW